jgi:hypothetical protein
MAADATYTGNQRILAPGTDKSSEFPACTRAISGAEGKPIKCSTVLKRRGLFISGTRTLARDTGNATHKTLIFTRPHATKTTLSIFSHCRNKTPRIYLNVIDIVNLHGKLAFPQFTIAITKTRDRLQCKIDSNLPTKMFEAVVPEGSQSNDSEPSGGASENPEADKSGGAFEIPEADKSGGLDDKLNIKVTDNNNEVFFKIKRATPFKRVMDAFCNRQGKVLNSVRFLFDGSRVQATDTPETVSYLSAPYILDGPFWNITADTISHSLTWKTAILLKFTKSKSEARAKSSGHNGNANTEEGLEFFFKLLLGGYCCAYS